MCLCLHAALYHGVTACSVSRWMCSGVILFHFKLILPVSFMPVQLCRQLPFLATYLPLLETTYFETPMQEDVSFLEGIS